MTQFNPPGNPGYDIQRPTGQCLATGKTFEPGEGYFAALVDVPEAEVEKDAQGKPVGGGLGLKRVDVSAEAWEQGFRPSGLFSYWKTTAPRPEAKKKLFVDDAVLMNLLRRLGEDKRPRRVAFRYVLALILMRKKLLRYDRTVKREGEDPETGDAVSQAWWIFTPKLDVSKGHFGKWSPDQTLEVLDPDLDEAGIEAVTRQLGEVLDAEL